MLRCCLCYRSKTSKDDKLVALKVTDRRLGLWETYIAKALQTRSPPEARPWFMNIEAALFSANRSFLISDICRHGTLSDLFKSQHFKNHVVTLNASLHRRISYKVLVLTENPAISFAFWQCPVEHTGQLTEGQNHSCRSSWLQYNDYATVGFSYLNRFERSFTPYTISGVTDR